MGSGGRRLGLPLARHGQPPAATATRTTTPNSPGPQREGPRQAVPTRPTPQGTRPTCHCGHGGHGARARGMQVGRSPPGAGHSGSPKDRSPLHPQLSRLPTCIGRGAAPVWGHPRRREEAGPGDSGLESGRHPTEASQGGAHPRRAAGSTVVSSWLRLFRWTPGTTRPLC
jgi:hypothetical protein